MHTTRGLSRSQGFKLRVRVIVHRLVGLHGMDAHAGVEHGVFGGEVDAGSRGLNGGASQYDVADAGRSGAFQNLRYLSRGVLVKVSMGVAKDGSSRHLYAPGVSGVLLGEKPSRL